METEQKLEIGSGNDPTDGYIHLDINPKAPHVEIVGDLRTIIAPQDYDREYPDLDFLKTGTSEDLNLYEEIIIKHFIEHIHWLYQPTLIKFLFNILNVGGTLEVETPDLEWIIKTYINGRGNWLKRLIAKKNTQSVKSVAYFPDNDHPEISKQTLPNLSRWTAFKLYSGGSYNKGAEVRDYHLGLYDKERLSFELTQVGFTAGIRRVFKGGTLKVLARKKILNGEAVKDYYQYE